MSATVPRVHVMREGESAGMTAGCSGDPIWPVTGGSAARFLLDVLISKGFV